MTATNTPNTHVPRAPYSAALDHQAAPERPANRAQTAGSKHVLEETHKQNTQDARPPRTTRCGTHKTKNTGRNTARQNAKGSAKGTQRADSAPARTGSHTHNRKRVHSTSGTEEPPKEGHKTDTLNEHAQRTHETVDADRKHAQGHVQGGKTPPRERERRRNAREEYTRKQREENVRTLMGIKQETQRMPSAKDPPQNHTARDRR